MNNRNSEKPEKAVIIKNLCKAYGQTILFEHVDLEIDRGDFVVFSGPSGCGKTTLLNMIGALEQLDQGFIEVNGCDISKKKNRIRYFSEVVGFLFQNFALIEEKTVRQNLEIIKSKNRSGISISKALRSVGLEDKMDNKVYTLSGGEQQRIALARLMIKKCDVILADEPTGSLDKNNAKAVMAILKALNQMGKTVILVSHDEEIKKQGSRLVELGKIG